MNSRCPHHLPQLPCLHHRRLKSPKLPLLRPGALCTSGLRAGRRRSPRPYPRHPPRQPSKRRRRLPVCPRGRNGDVSFQCHDLTIAMKLTSVYVQRIPCLRRSIHSRCRRPLDPAFLVRTLQPFACNEHSLNDHYLCSPRPIDAATAVKRVTDTTLPALVRDRHSIACKVCAYRNLVMLIVLCITFRTSV